MPETVVVDTAGPELRDRGLAALAAGGQLDRAESLLAAALALDPGDGDALLGMVIAARGRGRFDRSASLARRARRLWPDRAEPCFHLGRALLAQGRAAAGAAKLRGAVRRAPGWLDARYRLAEALRAAGDGVAADAFVTTVVALEPGLAVGWSWIGDDAARRADAWRAVEAYRRAIRIGPTAVTTWQLLCAALSTAGAAEAAVLAARRAIALAPDRRQPWFDMGRAWSTQGRFARAEPATRRAVILDPGWAAAAVDHLFLLSLDRWDEGIGAANRALSARDLSPTDRSTVIRLLGDCCARTVPDPRALTATAVGRAAVAILETGCGIGTRAALPDPPPADAAELMALAMLHRVLAQRAQGGSASPCPDVFHADHLASFLSIGTLGRSDRAAIFQALGYSLRSPRHWTMHLFARFVVPTLERALQRFELTLANDLVRMSQWSVYLQPHTEEQAALCYDAFGPLFAAAGHRLSGRLGPPPVRPVAGLAIVMGSPESDPPLHLERLVHLAFHHAAPYRSALGPFFLVSVTEVSTSFRKHYAELGVEVITPADCGDANVPEELAGEPLIRLAAGLRARGLHTLVYFNLIEGFADLLAAARLAPVQILMSADFYHAVSTDLEGRLAFGTVCRSVRTIRGRTWRCAQYPVRDSSPPAGSAEADALEAEAGRIRAALRGRFDLILGSIGRPEKLSEEFLDALGGILAANPSAAFLWFGQAELPQVRAGMERRGISERCLFQGWVDPRLYARVLDIHLDSFPFPAGLTMFDTLCAGGAHVWMMSAEAVNLSIVSSIEQLCSGRIGTAEEQAWCRSIFTARDGRSLFPCARGVDDYCRMAQSLIDDRRLRAEVGRAGRRFVERFMLDESRAVSTIFDHIAEIANVVDAT